MKVSGPSLLDRQTLLDRAASSGLFTTSQRTKAEGVLPPEAQSGMRAAQHLVQAGMLTQFQAERLLAGRTDGFVIGQYVIEDSVGRGAAGRVYRAKHRTMNRLVALKVLSPDLTRKPESRQAFHSGVRSAARLNHPNIVTTYDANEVGERFYVVLEFVDGPSVGSLVEQRGPLPWGEACEILRQAALGLKHAHDQGMTHRHLTPGNILIARNPKGPGSLVKLTDFGLSDLIPSLHKAPLDHTPLPPAVALAMPYTAPERTTIHPQTYDPRGDLFSLGAIFYLLLTGRPPSAGSYVPLPPHVPPMLAVLVTRLLAPDPHHRIANAAELLDHLNGFSQTALRTYEDRSGVNFEMPRTPIRNDSTTGGYLTGIPEPEASPWADIVAPFYESGPETLGHVDPVGHTPISMPALSTNDAPAPTMRSEKRPVPPRSSVMMLVVIAASMCVLSLCAIVLVMKYAAK